MPSEIFYPRFISNAPLGQDLYESKSQERIAKSICEHIKVDSSEYKLIGLDGEWGSGKSNAISIIESQLKSTHHVFIYDAWAHQEDLQRRSFLEELTDDLYKVKIIDQGKWKGKLKSLLAKKKESVKKTIPKLSDAIIVSIISIILLPFLSAVSGFWTSKWLKVLTTLLPIIIVIGFWAYINYIKRKRISLQDLFYLYQHKDLEEVSEETIAEDEPSIRKFRDWMIELSGDLTKNVIIVFDNMDRLPAEKVQIIWALIYTFFSAKPYSKITVIVPFDRAHIKNVFEKQNDNNFEKTNHFINKTFSVIFNISPAVLTDWKMLFAHKYDEAFGNTEKDGFVITRKLFDFHNNAITPRKIIAFINELVSYKLIWQKEISLKYIALFVLNRQKIIQNPVSQILNKEFLSSSQNLFGADEAVSDNIAALLYNVDLKKAVQITLLREIEVAIRERRIPELKEYCNNPDFLSILDQIPTEDIEVESSVISLVAIEPSIVSSENGEHIQLIWDRILGKQLTLEINKEAFTKTHQTLIEKSRPYQKTRLIRYLVKGFSSISEPSGEKYYTALNDLEVFLKEKKLEIDFLPFISERMISPQIFVDYLRLAKSNYKRYKLDADNDLLEKYFLEKIPAELYACEDLQFLKGQYKFPLIKDAIEGIIRDNAVTIENLLFVFNIYKFVSDTKSALSTKLADSKISELFKVANVNSAEYYELITMRLARVATFTPPDPATQAALQLNDESLVNEVAIRLEYYNSFGTMLQEVLTFPEPLLKSVLKMITLSDLKNTLNIERVLSKFKESINIIEVSPEEMVKKLNGWNSYLKEKLSINNLTEIIPDTIVFKAAFNVENNITSTISAQAIKYIEQASQVDFGTAYMDSNSHLFTILFWALEKNRIQSLPDNAFASYKEALKSIANSTENNYLSSIEIEKWNMLYEKSDKLHLKPAIKDIRDNFLRDIDISTEQFIFFELALREQGDLKDKAADVVRKLLTPVASNDTCMNIILTNKEFYTVIIDSAGNDAFGFIDFLRDKIENDTTNTELASFDKMINEGLARKISVIEANYFSPAKENAKPIDVTKDLKRIVEKEMQLHFLVNNGIANGNDPDPGNKKNLFVKFTYNSNEIQKTFEEYKWLRLP